MKTAIKQYDDDLRRPSVLKIGEVARLSGVGIESLRFYERLGLLGKPARTPSGYRLYSPEVLDRLRFIKQAQVLGFSLSEIAHLIAEKQAGHSPCAEVREIVRRRLQELDERLKEIERYRKELATALRQWDETGAAEGDICGLIEGTKINLPAPTVPGLRARDGRRGKKR